MTHSSEPATPETGSPGRESSDSVHGRRVRTGPIVWGVIVLATCAFIVQHILSPTTVDPGVWVIGVLLLLGVLLLVVGVAVVIRGRR